MKKPLQIWFDAWLAEHKDSRLFAIDAAQRQIMYVRDELSQLVWAGVSYDDLPIEGGPRGDCKVTAYVIGEHRSKSVRLPVYLIERPDLSLRFVLRGNFQDWKLSVASKRPITSELFPYLFHTTTPPIDPDYNELSSSYLEGFPQDLIFGYHEADPCRWSAALGTRELWTTIFLCMLGAGAIQPIRWHTREAPRQRLDLLRTP